MPRWGRGAVRCCSRNISSAPATSGRYPTPSPGAVAAFSASERSERAEECAQILTLLLAQADDEAGVVERHHVGQGRRRTVMEIRRMRREAAQTGDFELTDIGAAAGCQRLAGIAGQMHR